MNNSSPLCVCSSVSPCTNEYDTTSLASIELIDHIVYPDMIQTSHFTTKTNDLITDEKEIGVDASLVEKSVPDTRSNDGADEMNKKSENKQDIDKEKSKIRYFQCITIDENGNKHETDRCYSGLKPKQAARKAFAVLCSSMRSDNAEIGSRIITFGIRESTQGMPHKEFMYKGIRQPLDEPITITIKTPIGVKNLAQYNFVDVVKRQTQ